MFDDNLAFLIRSVACFGVDNLYVIGSVPPRSKLNSKSGSLYDYVNIKQFKNPSSFLSYSRENSLNLISLELNENSRSIYDFEFDFSKNNVIILGHETQGVPNILLFNSQAIHIPMPGVGFCLNVSQAGTAAMSEFCRQRGGML
jgi:tRNA G18 (ribose-2'-O)-methylase SpoU